MMPIWFLRIMCAIHRLKLDYTPWFSIARSRWQVRTWRWEARLRRKEAQRGR